MDSLRQRLKHFGADLHERVDEAFSAFSLETRQGYGDFLRAHGRAIVSLEHALESNGVETLIDDWPQRRRSEAVLADLYALGIAAEVPRGMPPIAGAGWCWGAL